MTNDNGEVLKALLNGVGERDIKTLDGDICFGDNGYYQENYLKNYFKAPIYVLDAFNEIYKIEPEKVDFNKAIHNKIILRSRGGVIQFNANRNEHEIDKSKSGDIIIYKHMFDENNILTIPECSLMISFNKYELEYRLGNDPEVVSLESKRDLIDKLLLKSFNQSDNPIRIMVFDSKNELPDELYTIINNEIVAIPVIKNTPDKSEIRIFVRLNNISKILVEIFELEHLESDEGFKVGNAIFYIAHSKDQIDEICRNKIATTPVGERLIHKKEIATLKKEYMAKYNKISLIKGDQDAVILQQKLDIKKLNMKIEKLISYAQGEKWFEKKFGDSIMEAKDFILKNNEINHREKTILNEIDLMGKKNEAAEIKNGHDIRTAEQREISAGLKRHGDATIMNEKIKHEKIKTINVMTKFFGDVFKKVTI